MCSPTCGWRKVDGSHALVVWQRAQLVSPPCCVPWQDTQVEPTFLNGVPWQLAHERLAWAPVSLNGCVKLTSLQDVGVWQEAQLVYPLCWSL